MRASEPNLDEAIDLDWVVRPLAIGGRLPDRSGSRLARELSIRAVVDMRSEGSDDHLELPRHGIEMLRLPTEDRCAVSQAMLRTGVEWVGRRLLHGEGVLVHCQHGIGRSALLCACLLVERGWAPIPALQHLKRVRPRVSPSPEQLNAMVEWCRSLRLEGGAASWDLPTVEALGALVWTSIAAR